MDVLQVELRKAKCIVHRLLSWAFRNSEGFVEAALVSKGHIGTYVLKSHIVLLHEIGQRYSLVW